MRATSRLAAAVAALVLVAAGCGGDSDGESTPDAGQSQAAPAIAGVKSVDMTADEFHQHYFGPLRYVQAPPFGGGHSTVPLNCGVYPTEVPSENAVHSLEHGAVWLTYRPGADPAPLAALTSIDPSYSLVSPFAAQASPVVASAWGLQLAVDSPTDPRLRQFVEAYVGNGLGGEKGARCAGASPEQAVGFRDSPPEENESTPPDPVDRAG